MNHSKEMQIYRARLRLQSKRNLAALLIAGESLVASLWRPLSWAAFFLGLWLLQIPSLFGAAGPGVAWALFTGGMIYWLLRDLGNLRWPEPAEIDRRLEETAKLDTRPLEIIDDRLANAENIDTKSLWQAQKNQAFAVIAKLRLPWPRAFLAQRDPYGLRLAALLLMVVGFVVAGPQAQERLQKGFWPYEIKLPGYNQTYLTLWITPPSYTAQERLTIEGTGTVTPISIPAGSILKARINNRWGRPVLHMGAEDYPMEALDKRSWGIERALEPAERLVITQLGLPRAVLPYELLPDLPPAIRLNAAPQIMEKAELQFSLTMNDDYGVTEMTMELNLDPVVEDRPLGQSFAETRAVMSGPGSDFEVKPLYDLAWHPWAGLPVEIIFTARDHLGQETASEPVKIILPERQFKHPVAAKLAELRRQLIWNPVDSAHSVSEEILKLMIKPETYGQDLIVFLSMRSMTSRLQYDPTEASAVEIIAQLWDTAIRIEDGNLPLAARELRTARAELEKLLSNPDATPDEIAAAVEKLRMAMNEYFRELAREMQKRFAQGEMMALSPELFETIINPDALATFLDQLQAQALTGDKDSARQMLSQLQQLMDNLDPSTNIQMPPQMEFMQGGINELQELIEKQRALLDITESYFTAVAPPPQAMPEFLPLPPGLFEKWGEDTAPPPPQWTEQPPEPAQRSVNTQHHAAEQDALRYILGKLMVDADEHLGEIPEKMGLAEQEMRASAAQLQNNEPALSAPHQEQAIAYLQDSMQEMAQQMAQMMQQMMMLSFGGGKTDPLGRPMQEGAGPSWMPGSQVKIPDEAERKRVQEIQKLLRERAGEWERPDYELDYFRRLLKQF